ncbi:hypothetical protein JAAARDRAFT_358971 [Jaapia argillacea MUCL 33604]|uniref:Uncharacterized protein n=1 Tax=Jaapia argillacea MUCL 33604 TaxID=933084 RepID=A0A067Q768_9AGAM|nr:hypothetical protein JAAARDRAFT_358971 [Jaapia argillacea MUCL 33604]
MAPSTDPKLQGSDSEKPPIFMLTLPTPDLLSMATFPPSLGSTPLASAANMASPLPQPIPTCNSGMHGGPSLPLLASCDTCGGDMNSLSPCRSCEKVWLASRMWPRYQGERNEVWWTPAQHPGPSTILRTRRICNDLCDLAKPTADLPTSGNLNHCHQSRFQGFGITPSPPKSSRCGQQTYHNDLLTPTWVSDRNRQSRFREIGITPSSSAASQCSSPFPEVPEHPDVAGNRPRTATPLQPDAGLQSLWADIKKLFFKYRTSVDDSTSRRLTTPLPSDLTRELCSALLYAQPNNPITTTITRHRRTN